jgi:hypothetical protein
VVHAAGVANDPCSGIGVQKIRHASTVVEMDVGQEDQIEVMDVKLAESLR